MNIAVFTKNSTNPAYEAFRIAADQVARSVGAKTMHFVPKKPDNVDEQRAMVEQVLKDRPDIVIFIPVDDVAMVESVKKLNEAKIPVVLASNPLPGKFVTYVGADDFERTPATPPVGAGQSAIFSSSGSTTVNVTMGPGPISPAGWTFTSASQNYTIGGADVNFRVAGPAGGIVSNADAGQTITIKNNIGESVPGITVEVLGNSPSSSPPPTLTAGAPSFSAAPSRRLRTLPSAPASSRSTMPRSRATACTTSTSAIRSV